VMTITNPSVNVLAGSAATFPQAQIRSLGLLRFRVLCRRAAGLRPGGDRTKRPRSGSGPRTTVGGHRGSSTTARVLISWDAPAENKRCVRSLFQAVFA